jgi:GTPase
MYLVSQLVPLFLTSNVTGDNTDLLIKLFNRLPKPQSALSEALEEEMQFQIQETFSISGVGTVLGGSMVAGQIYLSGSMPQLCLVGPDHGKFIPVIVHSLHRQRLTVKTLKAGQVGTCALKFLRQENAQSEPRTLSVLDTSLWTQKVPEDFKLRRGQVLIPITVPASSFWQITVNLSVLTHPNALFIGQEVKLHCGSINQPAKIISISNSSAPPSPQGGSSLTTPSSSPPRANPLQSMNEMIPVGELVVKSKRRRNSSGMGLGPGSNGFVTFRFSNEPEFIAVGATILIRDAEIKCVGKVLSRHLPHQSHAHR